MEVFEFSALAPDRFFESTEQALNALGDDVEAVVVDLDGVMIEVDGNQSAPELDKNVDRKVYRRFKDVQNSYKTCIITNRIRYDGFDRENLEEFFNTPVLEPKYRKPRKAAYEQVLEFLGTVPDKTVMIGDSPVMDIYGANRAGLETYQVSQNRSKYSFPENITKRMEDLAQTVFIDLKRQVRRV